MCTKNKNTILKDHHIKHSLCLCRKSYREGRKKTAVKTYTINDESRYLLVFNVPEITVQNELVKLFSSFGTIMLCEKVKNLSQEKFSECYRLEFQEIDAARKAKKKLDDYNFFGEVLHVCYSPESESVSDCRKKLQQRRIDISKRIKWLKTQHASARENNIKGKKLTDSALPSLSSKEYQRIDESASTKKGFSISHENMPRDAKIRKLKCERIRRQLRDEKSRQLNSQTKEKVSTFDKDSRERMIKYSYQRKRPATRIVFKSNTTSS